MKPRIDAVASGFLATCIYAGRTACREVERKRLGNLVLMRGWRMESISTRAVNRKVLDGSLCRVLSLLGLCASFSPSTDILMSSRVSSSSFLAVFSPPDSSSSSSPSASPCSSSSLASPSRSSVTFRTTSLGLPSLDTSCRHCCEAGNSGRSKWTKSQPILAVNVPSWRMWCKVGSCSAVRLYSNIVR